MHTKTSVLFFALLLCQSLFGQSAFTGFSVTSSGDTLRGQFNNYRQWSRSPATVQMTLTNGTKAELTPATAKSFTIEGYDTYLSYKGSRMINATTLSEAQNEYENTERFEDVHMFVRKVGEAAGISFWVLNDAKRQNLYYRQKDSVLKELRFRTLLQDGRYIERDAYRQQLFALLASTTDPLKLYAALGSLSYNDEQLEEFLNRLNNTTAAEPKNRTDGFVVFAGAAVNAFHLHYGKSSPVTRFPASVVPVAGFGYFLSTRRNFGRMFLLPQVRVYRFAHSGYNALTRTNVEYRSGFVAAVAAGIGYFVVNSARIKVFVAPGGAALLMPNNGVTTRYRTYSQKEKERTFGYNFNAQAGCLVGNRYLISGYYAFPTATTNRVYYAGRHSSLQMTVGYKF